jgi:hypothetical protein
VASPMAPQGQRHRRDRSLHSCPEPPLPVAAAGQWMRSGRGPPVCMQTHLRVPAAPGGTLGASLVMVASRDIRAMRDLIGRDGPVRVSIQGLGRAGCLWPSHRRRDLPAFGVAHASAHPQLRHLDVLPVRRPKPATTETRMSMPDKYAINTR